MQSRTLLVRLPLLCLAVALCLIAPGTAAAAPAARASVPAHQLRGVNLSPNRAFAPGGLSDDQNAREVASACQLRAGVVRVFVTWYLLEPTPGEVDPDYADRLSSLMREAGSCNIKVIFTLLGTPKWATSGSPTDAYFGVYPSRNGAGDYGWMVSSILRRWPGLYALEVWNEPNLSNYWRGSPHDYADMVNAAVAAKRGTGVPTLILAGTLSLGATDYLRQLYAAGMRGEDAVSIHPYATACTPVCGQLFDPGPRRLPFRRAIEGIHQVMLDNRDRSPLWLTEFGYSTCPSQPACVSDRTQAAWMTESIRIAACYPYVAGLTTFVLRDRTVPPSWDQTSWNFHFGLMSADFVPKPAFAAVADTFRALGASEARTRRARAAARRSPGAKRARARAAAPARACTRLLSGARKAKARPRR
jgi:hypothetical protein